MVRKLTRKELYDLVCSKPMTTLAKEFNLSDNGLRKICKQNNIPLPKIGHWAKIQYGHESTIIQLPKQKSLVEKMIEINVHSDKSISLKNSPDFLGCIINNKKLHLNVSKRLCTNNKLIIDAQSHIRTDKKSWTPASEISYTPKGFLDLVVAPKNVYRAFRIYDCLIRNLELLDYKILCDFSGTEIISFDNYKVKLTLREKFSVLKSIDRNGRETREFIPNETFSIKIDGFGTSEIKDSNNKSIEEQIPKILAKIEFRIQEIRDHRIKQALQEKEKARIEEIARKIQQIKDDEITKFRNFFNSAHRWKKYIVLKEYYNMICSELEKGNEIKDKEWILWAKEKLDWYNPLVDKKDSILSDLDKELY